MKELSVIIVNYNTPQLVLNCLESIFQFSYEFDFEVIIIDNDSSDNDEKLVSSRFPSVKWIRMSFNAGFARANNVGINMAEGKSVLLLNSDTIIKENAINNCLLKFRESHYLACGVQLLNEDGSPQISGNYNMIGNLNNLLSLPYLGRLIRWLGYSLKVSPTNIPNATDEIEVDWINGAFLMVKKEAISKAGLLDEDFFLYAEEAEWCGRIQKHGNLCIYGQFKVTHLQGQSAKDTFQSTTAGYSSLYDRKGGQIMVSNFLRIRKQFGSFWLLFHFFIYVSTIPVIAICGLIHSLIFPSNFNYYGKLLMGFSKNVFTLSTYIPTMIRNNPYFYKVL